MSLRELSFGRILAALVAIVIGTATTAICGAEKPVMAFPVAEAAFPAELAGIDREWNLSFKTAGKVRVVAAADLAYWGRIRDVEAGPQVVLADGGMIRTDALLIDEKQVVLGDATGLGRGMWDESALPRAAVRGVLLQPPAGVVERDRIWKEVARQDQSEDRVWLRGGESISGTLVGAPRLGRFWPEDAKAGSEAYRVVRRAGAEPLDIPAAKVVAVGFGGSGAAVSASGRMSAWLGLSDGSLVRAGSVSLKGDTAAFSLIAGGELKATFAGRDDSDKRLGDLISYVEPVTQRVAWLSEIQPAAYRHVPFVSVERPLGVDACVLGMRLRNERALFRKGLGMPSASRVEYGVAGYRKFEAEIAIDDAAELAGSVVFKVEIETTQNQWQTAYESAVVRGGDAPISIAVDLRNAPRLALIVEFADRGDVCDYADWLNARLIK